MYVFLASYCLMPNSVCLFFFNTSYKPRVAYVHISKMALGFIAEASRPFTQKLN